MTEHPRTEIFIDTETTGLDPAIHHAYEVAWAVGDDDVQQMALPHTLAHADPIALVVGHYFERGFAPHARDFVNWRTRQLARLLTDVTLIGANPAFDAAFLRKAIGYAPWHYRLVDIETYAMAIFGWPEPRGLYGVTTHLRNLGHTIPEPDHTAAGDVLTTRAVWHVLRGL